MRICRILFILLIALPISSLQAQITPELLVTIHTTATTAEMNGISPSIGALIFNDEDDRIYVHNGTIWVPAGSAVATPGSVSFAGSTGAPAEDNGMFFYDDANNRLGIGTNTPTETLEINGDINVSGGYKDSNGSFGTAGQVLTSTVTGTEWGSSTFLPALLVKFSNHTNW